MEILENVRVLDLSQIMAGPLCSMILGDLGAEVIKIEPPEGDASRAMGDTFLKGQSGYFLSLNRNKRSIVIDLKNGKGREIFYRLAREVDIVLENFRPGTVEKLGVDYTTISKINPGIIYCSISGFGQKGPYKDRPATDSIIQAMGGVMGITGDSRTGPVKVGTPISDLEAPLLATIGILGALYTREKTREGQKIEISLLDGIIFSLTPRAAYYFIRGESLPLAGNQNPQIAPSNTFPTKDGRYLTVVAHTEKHWINLCKRLGRTDLKADQRFKTNSERLKNIDELNKMLGEIFQGKTQQEWVELLSNKGVIIAPVYTFQQLFQDPQVIQDEIVVEMDHPLAGKIKNLKTPINLSKTPLKIKKSPPILGQHTEEILLEFGYKKEEIQQFEELGVVKKAAI